jgi:hypothetical protein
MHAQTSYVRAGDLLLPLPHALQAPASSDPAAMESDPPVTDASEGEQPMEA